jgi:uncharacterized protein
MVKDLGAQLKEVGLQMQPYWDAKYLKNMDKLSKPEYKVKEEKDVYAPVRDGVKLCLDVFRPDTKNKKFPALIAWSSYGKSEQSYRRDPVPSGAYLLHHSIEIPEINFFATRGYAFIIPDTRGCGKSEGIYYGPFAPQEQDDAYDIIEWAAKQPWCDGNVGMAGVSYFGIMQLLTAGRQPPHLKAIMPWKSLYNLQEDGPTWGGILSDFQHYFYLNYNGHTCVSQSEKVYGEAELKRKIQEALKDPVIQSNTFYVKILETWPPRYNTIFLDILLNYRVDSPYWQAMSAKPILSKIKCPTYLLAEGCWEPFLDPNLKVPKKLFDVGKFPSPDAHPCAYRYTQEEVLRWYDHWLKNIDTGIMDEPPIKVYMGGVNQYKFENEWPLKRTKWTTLYLQQYKQLATMFPNFQNKEPDAFVHVPLDLRTMDRNVPSLMYTTKPVNKPIELCGPFALNLFCSIDAPDANFIIAVWDLGPGGQRMGQIGRYSLRAQGRGLDKEKSTPYAPVIDRTKELPIKPGEIIEYSFPMTATHVLMPGHCLGVEIAAVLPLIPKHTSSSTIGPMPQPWTTCYKIYHDAEHPSRLILPVIPETPRDAYIPPTDFDEYLS